MRVPKYKQAIIIIDRDPMLGHIEGRGARGERRARQGLRQREGHGGVFQTMNRISFTVAMPTIQKLLVIK